MRHRLRTILEFLMPHFGGSTTSTQASLAPELRPLFSQSGRNLMNLQNEMPLGDFGGQYPEETAPLSDAELQGMNLSYGLDSPSPMDALAMRMIMQEPDLAGASPGFTPDFSGNPDISTYFRALQNPVSGSVRSPSAPQGAFGPTPRPLSTLPGYSTIPTAGGPGDERGRGTDPGPGGGGGPLPLGMRTTTPTGVAPRPDPTTIGTRGTPAPPPPTGGGLAPMGASTTGAEISGWDAPGITPAAAPGYDGPGRAPISQAPPPTRGPIEHPFYDPFAQPPGGANPTSSPDTQAMRQIASGGGGKMVQQNLSDQLTNDPTVTAALNAFKMNSLPSIQNQNTLAGLGRSTATGDSIAKAQAGIMQPIFENALARNERAGVRRSEATQAAANQLLGLSQQENARRQGAITTLMKSGGVQRGVAQNIAGARYQDLLRRQGLAENAQNVAFGGALPSAFGSRQVTSK